MYSSVGNSRYHIAKCDAFLKHCYSICLLYRKKMLHKKNPVRFTTPSYVGLFTVNNVNCMATVMSCSMHYLIFRYFFLKPLRAPDLKIIFPRFFPHPCAVALDGQCACHAHELNNTTF